MSDARIIYKGEPLDLTKVSEGGKNASLRSQEKKSSIQQQVNGFYKDSKGQEYFIKKPKDKKEIFTELFAGKILEQFLAHEILDEKLRPSLIYADTVKLPDGSYALIQPKMEFKEFYKQIYEGTRRAEAKDRDAALDVWNGSALYADVLGKIKPKNLAVFLVLSIILGDYSVHSGNMVLLEEKEGKDSEKSVESESARDGDGADLASSTDNLSSSYVWMNAPKLSIARIDFGASFRFYGANDNKNILCPAEYESSILDWTKLVTKNYLRFYRKVPGLFDEQMPQEGIQLRNKLGLLESKDSQKSKLREIILDAVRAVPVDLIDDTTRQKLAEYMCMPTFAGACQKDSNVLQPDSGKSPNQLFAYALADIMYARIEAVAELSNQKRLELELDALSKEYQKREVEHKSQMATKQRESDAKHTAELSAIRKEILNLQAQLKLAQEDQKKKEDEIKRIQQEKQEIEGKSAGKDGQNAQLVSRAQEKDREIEGNRIEIERLREQVSLSESEKKDVKNTSFNSGICFGLSFSTATTLCFMSYSSGIAALISPLGIILITVAAITLVGGIYFQCRTSQFFKPRNKNPDADEEKQHESESLKGSLP